LHKSEEAQEYLLKAYKIFESKSLIKLMREVLSKLKLLGSSENQRNVLENEELEEEKEDKFEIDEDVHERSDEDFKQGGKMKQKSMLTPQAQKYEGIICLIF